MRVAEPITYSFGERLAMSHGTTVGAGVEAVLLSGIPGAVRVQKADQEADRQGTDWWVHRNGLGPLSVDAKVRANDWAAKPEPYRADDLALETWSVVEKEVPGWTRDPKKRSDYILWLWQDTGRWCLVAFPMLCRVMQEHWARWKDQYKHSQQFTPEWGGYHSECVFVPRREVWAAMYRMFAGNPPSQN